jgi:ubiquinone/menaquinone biosynthesis C-methylase UbiE/uncharacterized protein YbaR (Trm112 family)
MSIVMPAKIESLFCCPLCKGALTAFARDAVEPDVFARDASEQGERDAVGHEAIAHGFTCGVCNREYPEIAGIVDFRICADPYIDIPADRAKALRIASKADSLKFEELVAFYYSITPEVPDDLGRHYLNHHVAGVTRGEGILHRMRSYQLSKQAEPGVELLDLGCGTGGFLAAASAQGASCVGADIALRWLVIASSRFRDLNCRDITLVCACADHLPFVADSFDVILAENLIEHCSDTTKVLLEIKRIRRGGGAFLARTINRFAMGPEPHVGVWGVGYLPRRLMNGYVKLVKGIPYEHIHLESFGSLKQSIQTVDDRSLETKVPLITEADYAHHPKWKQQLFKLYSGMIRLPILGAPMAHLGPYIDIVTQPMERTTPILVTDKNAIYNSH